MSACDDWVGCDECKQEDADSWCPVCQLGFCDMCLEGHLRDHEPAEIAACEVG